MESVKVTKVHQKNINVKILQHSPQTQSMVENGMKLLNSLPDDNILDWSKLKQIADDILKYI